MKTYTSKRIAEEMFAGTVTQKTEFVFADDARSEAARLRAEVERLREDVERLREELQVVAGVDCGMSLDIDDLRTKVERLTRKRDEARAKIGCLDSLEVLARHQGSPLREWHSVGSWLWPGDSIALVPAPLPKEEDGR